MTRHAMALPVMIAGLAATIQGKGWQLARDECRSGNGSQRPPSLPGRSLRTALQLAFLAFRCGSFIWGRLGEWTIGDAWGSRTGDSAWG